MLNLHKIRNSLQSLPTGNLNTRFKAWADGLTPATRRYIVLGGIAVIAVLLLWNGMPQRQARTTQPNTGKFDFKQPDMAGEVMAEKLQDNISALNQQLKEMQHRMDKVEKARQAAQTIAPVSPALPMPGTATPSLSDKEMLKTLAESTKNAAILQGSTDNLYAPGGTKLEQPKSLPDKGDTTKGRGPMNMLGNGQGNAANGDPNANVPRVPDRAMGVITFTPPAPKEADKPQGMVGKDGTPQGEAAPKEDDKVRFYLPAASIFPVKLLTGLDAPTGQKAKKEPSPVALRIQDMAWLPNEFKQNVKGCIILTEGIGELSTERVSMRGISISCIDTKGVNVIDQKLLGYIADEDGKAGMRGQVVSKAGKLLAQTMVVGFVQGIADFFQMNSRTVMMGPTGMMSGPAGSMNQNSGTMNFGGNLSGPELSNNLLGGVMSGVGKSLDKVAEYYMSLAEEVFPVIQISATRSATFVVTQGAELVMDKKLNGSPKGGKSHEKL